MIVFKTVYLEWKIQIHKYNIYMPSLLWEWRSRQIKFCAVAYNKIFFGFHDYAIVNHKPRQFSLRLINGLPVLLGNVLICEQMYFVGMWQNHCFGQSYLSGAKNHVVNETWCSKSLSFSSPLIDWLKSLDFTIGDLRFQVLYANNSVFFLPTPFPPSLFWLL